MGREKNELNEKFKTTFFDWSLLLHFSLEKRAFFFNFLEDIVLFNKIISTITRLQENKSSFIRTTHAQLRVILLGSNYH